MFIQRLEQTKASFWKFLLIPVLFFALMVYNFWVTINSPVDTATAMKQMIELLGFDNYAVCHFTTSGLGILDSISLWYSRFKATRCKTIYRKTQNRLG